MKIINLRFSFDHKGIRFFTHFTFKNRYLCMSRLEFPPLSYLTSYIIFGIDVILNKIVETCQCHDQWNELFYRQNRAISHKRIFDFVIIRKNICIYFNLVLFMFLKIMNYIYRGIDNGIKFHSQNISSQHKSCIRTVRY